MELDQVIYINLDERTDRNRQVLSELQYINIPKDKITRLSAVKDSPGFLGCTQSHILAVELIIKNGWKNTLIVEDDITFNRTLNLQEIFKNIRSFSYDVCLLLASFPVITHTNGIMGKIINASTACGYIVRLEYAPVLLQNFKEGYELLRKTRNYELYAIDKYWTNEMRKGVWLLVLEKIAFQRAGFSDIENKSIDYREFYA